MTKIERIIVAILERFKQKTTWVGIIGLLTTGGCIITPELALIIIAIGSTLSSVLLIAFDEDSNK